MTKVSAIYVQDEITGIHLRVIKTPNSPEFYICQEPGKACAIRYSEQEAWDYICRELGGMGWVERLE